MILFGRILSVDEVDLFITNPKFQTDHILYLVQQLKINLLGNATNRLYQKLTNGY